MDKPIDEIRQLFPLSLSQRSICDLERTFSGTSINAISTTISVKGRTDILLLERALNIVLSSDISLRTRIKLRENTPMQYFAKYEEEHFRFFNY